MLPLLAAAIPSLISGIGSLFGQSDEDKAAEARQKALNAILGIQLPGLADQQIDLSKYTSAGTLTPEAQETVNLQDSEMGGVSTDPRLKEAQMKSLATLEQLGSTGLSAADREALMQIRNKASGDSQAAQASIMQNMAARGQAGGGQELAARLLAGQQGANRTSAEGMSIAAQAQQRALDAIAGAGSLGGNIRNQEFGEQAQKANAQDLINKFNTANRQQVIGSNVGARNAAQAANLAAEQARLNANTGLTNQQQLYNKELLQKKFDNEMRQKEAAAGAYNKDAAASSAGAAATRGTWGDIGQGVGQGVSAYMANSAKTATPKATNQDLTEKDKSDDAWAKYYSSP